MSEIDFGLLMVEIFEEISEIDSAIGTVYLKHFSFIESKKISLYKSRYEQEALRKGLSKEKDIVSFLIKDGVWDEASESFIREKRAFVENLKKSLSKIQIPSQRENHKKLIEMEEAKLLQKEEDRKQIIGITAESYATSKANYDFLNSFMFIDKKGKKLLADEIDHDSLSEKDIEKIQVDFFKKFSDVNISKLALSDDFSPLISYSKTPNIIFGKNLKDMTVFQIKLSSFAKSFLNIFENTQKEIPNYVAKDPDLLIEFYEAQRNSSKKESKARRGEGGTTYFGANSSDIEALASENERQVSLAGELKKRGGKLDMQQMMALHGV